MYGPSDDDGANSESSDSVLAIQASLEDVPFETLERMRRSGYHRQEVGTVVAETEKKKRRSDKNKPRELSSKVPVSRFRQSVLPSRAKARDPRFDNLGGQVDMHSFRKQYGFLREYRQREIQHLKDTVASKSKKHEVPEEAVVAAKNRLVRLQQQEFTAHAEEQKRKRMTGIKKMERSLVNKGKKPFYLKKTDMRALELLQKYDELKASGGEGALSKYMARRRRKRAAKAHRLVPSERLGANEKRLKRSRTGTE